MNNTQLQETMIGLESSLNHILEHFREGATNDSMVDRLDDIKTLTKKAKHCFDMLDNFAIIRPMIEK